MAIDKSAALSNWKGHTEDQNRLFYQARNLAVEALCLRLENQCLRAGLDVSVRWKESSFPGTLILLALKNPKENASWEEAEYYLHLKRSSVKAPGHLSDCFYTYTNWSGPSWRHKPVLAVKMAALLDDWSAAQDKLPEWVSKVNYPFDYIPASIY